MNNILQNIHIFQWLKPEHLDIIWQEWNIQTFQKWDFIIQEWKKDTHFYVLLEWIVNVLQNNKNINTIFSWDIFWEISLVTQEPRTASIQAETSVKVLVFEKDILLKIMKKFDTNGNIQATIINRIIMNHKK